MEFKIVNKSKTYVAAEKMAYNRFSKKIVYNFNYLSMSIFKRNDSYKTV